MRCSATTTSSRCAPARWQPAFLRLLPDIRRQLSFAFRHLDPATRQEAMQEGLANCCVRYAQLHQQQRTEVASATSLAQFAIRQVRSGRSIATPLNSHEPLSRYAQLRRGLCVQSLDEPCSDGAGWLAVLVADRRTAVAEQAALRIDFAAWLSGLASRLRRIARDLALGFTTAEVAIRHGLSPSRISQLRRELYESWLTFQGLSTTSAAVSI